MRVLVTGSAGFLGRHVCARLSQHAGHEVYQYDNLEPLSGHHGPIHEDVTSYALLENVVKAEKIDAIIHLAAFGRNLTCQDHPRRAWEVNVNGTLNVLEVARKFDLPRVVVCSSNITLSDQLTVYRESKLAVESLVKLYASLDVSVMGLRPSNIYGKGQSRTEYQPCAFAGLDMGFERDGYVTITGDGTQTRDWVHVEDVARAFELILGQETLVDYAGKTFDVCTGVQTSMNEVAALLKVPVKYTDPRPSDAKVLISDPGPLNFQTKLKLKDRILDAFPAVAAARR